MICGSGRALKLGLRATSGSFMNTPSNTLSTVVHRKRGSDAQVLGRLDLQIRSGYYAMARANKLHFRGFRVYSQTKLLDSSSVLRIPSIIKCHITCDV